MIQGLKIAVSLTEGQVLTWSQLNSLSSCGAETKQRYVGGEGQKQRR